MINPTEDPWCPGIDGKVPNIKEGLARDGRFRLADLRDEHLKEWNLD